MYGAAAAAFDSLYVGELPDVLTLCMVFAADSTGRVVRIARAQLLMPEKRLSATPPIRACRRRYELSVP